MKTRHRIARLTDTCGEYLIEFSISLFVLMMLIFGVIEVSRMILVYNTVANAARAGVRYAIVNGTDQTTPATSGTVTTVVTNFAAAAPLNTANLNTSVGGAGGAVGSTVTVTVTYAYDPLTTFVPLNVNLSSTSQGVIVF